jgi:hypothetical protein
LTRAERAHLLAERVTAAREALLFYARIAEFRGGLEELRTLVRRIGPPLLREQAAALDPAHLPPEGFFARVLLRQQPPAPPAQPSPGQCPHCGGLPQAGCLRPAGDGHALYLICGICLREWPYPRAHCPACGQTDERRIALYSNSLLDHVQLRVCKVCRRYLHVAHCGQDPLAIPDVDEVAALPMDVWAREQGWEKICPNLIGI